MSDREVVIMAARLTDRQKKKIIADYVQLGSYNATAKVNGVSLNTVKKIVQGNAEIAEMCNRKKDENTVDILAYMEGKRKEVCNIIEVGLSVLPEKIKTAKSASEVTTALGTLIDKWATVSGGPADTAKEDELSKSLREMAEELESDE